VELIYLWVEDYKNIHNQGFNFSSKFNCHYDGETLTIDDNVDKDGNKQYIENFFGDNINVTAIVGKNGSGKSSILEFILDMFAERHNMYLKNFIFIYFYEKKLYKYSNFKYKIFSNLSIEEYSNYYNLINHHKDAIAVNINSEYKEFEMRNSQQIFNENNKYDKYSSNLVILENYIIYKNQVNKTKENFFIPHKIRISIKTIGRYLSILRDNRVYYSDNDWEKILNLIAMLKDKNFNESLEIIKKIFKLKREKHKNYNEFITGLYHDMKNSNQYYFDEYLLKSENIPKILKKYRLNNSIAIENIDDCFLSYIKKLPYIFKIDLIDKNDINIDSLSFGEKQLFIQLHYILSYSSKKEYKLWHTSIDYEEEEDVKIKNIFIFLDEFEIGLHPRWQKKSINYIINFLKELKGINFNIILTSHSPFLLSDIPKQNIIFLDKDEKGNCIVVDGLKEKKETFGANIHTLLSDSFFMEDGLMGEFAKNKIQEIMDFLNNKKKIEEISTKEEHIKQVIESIGEPFLKDKLLQMYYNKFDTKKQERIKELKAELKRLENG